MGTEAALYMLKLHGLSLLLQLALTAPALASLTSVNESGPEPLRIAFAPHPFLSHWAVSAPIAHELLQRGHKALVSHTVRYWFRSKSLHSLCTDLRFAKRKHHA